eukprot:CAMPEP_0184373420 /NCGR_PEP_ID=MMETSP1089-20130417/164496_1 /TAXON_ID=38269 ORGANISM="Gloeochaete wittrockiana, Strain SAG46.84" /NCGR_SAMPLE_ID=MMETSP1089 /ASSEMBLY_ACC=CAM_ASM_000445 /LENGTH=63 /DNA_ID=CAMNT_0026716385 /DNA_START=579 /DNA_END=770 /DNA_ORIENTATION=-
MAEKGARSYRPIQRPTCEGLVDPRLGLVKSTPKYSEYWALVLRARGSTPDRVRAGVGESLGVV